MIARPERSDPVIDPSAAAVVAFWRKAGEQGRWFDKNDDFDRAFREQFLDLHLEVASRCHDDWIAFSESALALLILTDQFPRNAFRGSARMYETDDLARHYAREALQAGHMENVDPELALFFCLPFAHSEDPSDQDVSVLLNASLGQPWLDHAEDHREIARRFGRFPHRNPILGRIMTSEEFEYLRGGGFQG